MTAGQIPLALSVLQILALDIGTDLLPALALGAEPPEPGVMERPPRTRSARSLDGAVLARASGSSARWRRSSRWPWCRSARRCCSAGVRGALPAGGPALATLSTMVFAAIVLAQMANAL